MTDAAVLKQLAPAGGLRVAIAVSPSPSAQFAIRDGDNFRGVAVTLGRALAGENFDLVLPWGTPDERERSDRIAAALPRARVPDQAPLDVVARLLAGARFVVGVDTGLLHLAAALGVPLVAIFVGSNPSLTGPIGYGPMAVLGAEDAPPSVGEVVDAVGKTTR